MMKKYGRIGPILTEEVQKKHSERMKKKNPMFNIDIKNKMIKTLQETLYEKRMANTRKSAEKKEHR